MRNYMYLLLTLSLIYSQESYLRKIAMLESDSEFHFVGEVPTEKILPEFDFSTKNKIDTATVSYYLELKTAIPLYNLVLKDSIEKKFGQYKIEVAIYDQNKKQVDGLSKTLGFALGKYITESMYLEQLSQTFNFNLNPNTYSIFIQTTDLNSGKKAEQNSEFVLRNSQENEILISDPFFYNNTGEEVISSTNNIQGSKKSVTMKFVTYKKLTKNNYTIDVMVKPKIVKMRDIISNLIDEVILSDREKIHQLIDFSSIDLDTMKRLEVHEITYNSDLFSKIVFSKKERSKASILTKFDVLKHSSKYYDHKKANAVDINTVDFTKSNLEKTTFTDKAVETSVKSIYKIQGQFSLYWNHIPNTEKEFEYIVSQMQYAMKPVTEIFHDSLTLYQSQKHYISFWKEYALKNDYPFWINAKDHYFRKINFVNNNFRRLELSLCRITTTIIDGVTYFGHTYHVCADNTAVVVPSPFNDGHLTDKGKMFMLHGLPNGITGNNFVNVKGLLDFNYKNSTFSGIRLPIQIWKYEKLGKFVFLGNDFPSKAHLIDKLEL